MSPKLNKPLRPLAVALAASTSPAAPALQREENDKLRRLARSPSRRLRDDAERLAAAMT